MTERRSGQVDLETSAMLEIAPVLRPAALARGRARLRSGPVAPEVLAAAMLEAHALLRTSVLH